MFVACSPMRLLSYEPPILRAQQFALDALHILPERFRNNRMKTIREVLVKTSISRYVDCLARVVVILLLECFFRKHPIAKGLERPG